MKRGFGRCEESMIIYIAAARAVGIPARPASVPFWNFTDNNHAWVEVWTPTGWKYLGEAENALNRAWFSKTTERATLITAHAIGNFPNPNTIKQENNVTSISSIEYYTTAKDCNILVLDEQYQSVFEADVYLYAVSYGGLFAMTKLKTENNGRVFVPLGDGTVFVSAYKDGKFGASLFPIMETDSLILKLSDKKSLEENLIFQFPIPTNDSAQKDTLEILGKEFYLMRENAHLKRKERLANQAKSKEFIPFYQKTYWYKIQNETLEEQKQFLDKCDELAGNSELFLKGFQHYKDQLLKQQILIDMILEWDIKELVEIPDSTALFDIVNIYANGKIKNSKVLQDSLFRSNVIKRLWTSSVPPENGWQGEFYEKIKHLAANNLDKTVQNVIQWVDEQIIVDSSYTFSYFSGSLNPVQMLNMKHIPDFYRIVLIKSALKQLGVPLQWKGRLEYFNGDSFVSLEDSSKEEKTEDKLQSVIIQLFVDEKPIKAEPFSNFLISKLHNNGEISYTFFEGDNDSLDFKASFRRKDEDVIFLQAAIRNSNGDANVLIKTIYPNDEIVKILLNTPREFVDVSSTFTEKSLQRMKKISQKIHGKYKIIFILGKEKNEPEERMYLQMQEKMAQFDEIGATFKVISLRADNFDFVEDSVKIDNKLSFDKIPDNQFPLLFLYNAKNELLFSGKGYKMGISDLLLRKMK
jgi:hypothetical protein